MGETFTELDVEERRALLEKLKPIEPGEHVRLTWESKRGSGPVSIEGRTRDVDRLEGNRNPVLYVATDEREGNIFVDYSEGHLENQHFSPIVAHSLGNPWTSRQPRLGELLDVEALEGDDAA